MDNTSPSALCWSVKGSPGSPASGTAIPGKGVVICKYPYDPTVVLGYLSVGFLVASTVAGYFSLFYPYQGKSIPQSAMFRSTSFVVFFNIAV
ncbi:unnamed protein product [Thlaspi arvense]|uniref:Uncharacterized protein n=1 Tax=Thlaspi arvense TaxID=13288 RepID=A0AAU9S649_THLAR|nr:unnamed protein product [Thlaspi arvense]